MSSPARSLLALAYLAFVSLGLPDTVLGVAWPSVRGAFGVSQAGLGAVLSAGMGAYAFSGLVSGRWAGAVGVGRLLAASSALVAAGLVGYAIAPGWLAFLAMAPVIGLGSGAIDSALNAYAARHFAIRHVQWLHAAWSAGATAGPALMTSLLAAGGSFRAGYAILAAILGAMALAFAVTRSAWDDGRPSPGVEAAAPRHPAHAPAAVAGGAPVGGALRRGGVWLQVAVFFAYTGFESATGYWCFTSLRDGRGLPVASAGAWTAAYWGSLLAGRVLLGFVIERVGPDRLLRIATATAIAGAAAFAASGGLAGRIGLLAIGASLAPMYPTLMARTPHRTGDAAAARVVGYQVTAATLGAAAVPSVVGGIAARAGVDAIGPAILAAAAVLAALHEALVRATRPGRDA